MRFLNRVRGIDYSRGTLIGSLLGEVGGRAFMLKGTSLDRLDLLFLCFLGRRGSLGGSFGGLGRHLSRGSGLSGSDLGGGLLDRLRLSDGLDDSGGGLRDLDGLLYLRHCDVFFVKKWVSRIWVSLKEKGEIKCRGYSVV